MPHDCHRLVCGHMLYSTDTLRGNELLWLVITLQKDKVKPLILVIIIIINMVYNYVSVHVQARYTVVCLSVCLSVWAATAARGLIKCKSEFHMLLVRFIGFQFMDFHLRSSYGYILGIPLQPFQNGY